MRSAKWIALGLTAVLLGTIAYVLYIDHRVGQTLPKWGQEFPMLVEQDDPREGDTFCIRVSHVGTLWRIDWLGRVRWDWKARWEEVHIYNQVPGAQPGPWDHGKSGPVRLGEEVCGLHRTWAEVYYIPEHPPPFVDARDLLYTYWG